MGDIQGTTNTILEGRFIRKKQVRKLDSRREEYASLIEKARELNAKGKTDKATKAFAKADDIANEYNTMAQSLGLYADLASTMPKESNINLVPDGVKLTKDQRKTVEALEKGIEDTQKTLKKFSKVQLNRIEKGLPTELSAKDEAKAKEALRKNKELTEFYNETCEELGIPSPNDILAKLYSIADPVKASKLRKEIKDELKAANMYFGFTKDYMKDDSFKNVSESIAIENKVNDTLAKGYAGVGKKTARAMEGVSLVDAAYIYDGAFGADKIANRNGNERTKANYALNVTQFGEDFVNANMIKSIAELSEIKLAGTSINPNTISRVTLLSGEVVTGIDIKDVLLKDIRTVEANGVQYSTQPMEYEKGKDSAYISRKKTNRAAKAMGYKFEKADVAKPLVDATGMGLVTGATALLTKYKFVLNDKFYLSMQAGSGTIESTVFEEMFKEIEEKLKANGGEINKLVGVEGFEYIKNTNILKEYWAAGPCIAAAATTFVASLVDQYMKKEEIVPEKAYNAARERLTLEMKHNASGGDGYILNQKELDKALADLDVVLSKLLDTKVKKTPQETTPTSPVTQPQAKVLEVETRGDKAQLLEDAKYCTYNNKAGEHWDGIVRTSYKDANGKLISNEADISELRRYTKQTLNNYKLSDTGMPKGVRLQTTYTCKSGRTYTFDCSEPEKRIVSKELPKDKDGNVLAANFGKARVNLNEGTNQVWSKGTFGYTISENGTVIFDSGLYEDDSTGTAESRGTADKAKDEKYYEDQGYTIIRK